MLPPRLLTPADADLYAAFRREMLHDSPWAFSATPEEDRGCDPAQLRASLAQPDFAIHAVIEAGLCLAAASVVRDSKRKRRHLALIWGVYVTPTARGRGLGRAVTAAAIETARHWEGITGVRLAVSSNAPTARRLYESLGFAPWGTEPDALRVDGRSYAETFMHLPF